MDKADLDPNPKFEEKMSFQFDIDHLQALEELDKGHLVRVMTEELVRTSKQAVGMMLIDSVVRGILNTRNIQSYDHNFHKEYQKLLDQFNRGENQNGL